MALQLFDVFKNRIYVVRFFFTGVSEPLVLAVLHQDYGFFIVCSPAVKEQEVIIEDITEVQPGLFCPEVILRRAFNAMAGTPALLKMKIEANLAGLLLRKYPTKFLLLADEVQPPFSPGQGGKLTDHIFFLTDLRRVFHDVKTPVPYFVELRGNGVLKFRAPQRTVNTWLQPLNFLTFVEQGY